MSTTTNDRTQELSKVPKVTALPEGCSVAIIDKTGTVLESIEAEKFFQAVRDSIQIGGRNLLRNTNQGATNWLFNSAYPTKVTEEYIYPDGTKGVHLKVTDTGTVPSSGNYKIIIYYLKDALFRLEPNTDYVLSFELEALTDMSLTAQINRSNAQLALTNITARQDFNAGDCKHVFFELKTKNFSSSDLIDQVVYLTAGFCECHIRDIKLEKGNIPTDWTPAPEDIIGGGNSLVCRLLRGVVDAISPQPSQKENYKEINNCLN